MHTNDSACKILLVDDDPFSRKMLQMLLEKVGYPVVEAQNGKEGLELYQQIFPTLVLLDAKMPDMDGFDCCRQLRQLPGGQHIPILMVTGLGDQTSVDKAFEAGATDYVTKPVQIPVLTGRIRYLIQSAHAEQALRASEEKYRSLITSLQEVIFQLDNAGRLIFINPVWHKLMGYNLEKSLGRPFESFLHPAERQRHWMLMDRAWKRPTQCFRYRSRCLTQSGKIRWVDVQLCANIDDDGTVLDIAGRLNDITDRTIREQYRSLAHAITRVLSNAENRTLAIRRSVQAFCGNLGCQLGEFWQLDPHTQLLQCHERWHLKTEPLRTFANLTKTLSFKPGEGIPGLSWEAEKAFWIKDISQDSVFIRKEAAEKAGLRSLLACPVIHGSEKLGVIMLFSQEISPPDEDLIRMLTILSRQLSQYLKRQQAEAELQRQNELLQLELQRAAQYVEALLPDSYNETGANGQHQNSIWINTQYQPSSALGGDAFDYAWLDDETLMFYLLDVAGHGVKSALLSVSILNILRKRTLKGADFYQPETVLRALNEVFQANEEGEDYFTLWYGIYHCPSRQLTFASAGHPPGVLITPADKGYRSQYLDSDGIAVGWFPNISFDVKQVEIPTGSSLYIFSDGVYEIPSENNCNKIWGLDAWTELLQKHKETQCPNLKPLLTEVRRINGSNILADDFSVLAIGFA